MIIGWFDYTLENHNLQAERTQSGLP
jgi:hypothetical protein